MRLLRPTPRGMETWARATPLGGRSIRRGTRQGASAAMASLSMVSPKTPPLPRVTECLNTRREELPEDTRPEITCRDTSHLTTSLRRAFMATVRSRSRPRRRIFSRATHPVS